MRGTFALFRCKECRSEPLNLLSHSSDGFHRQVLQHDKHDMAGSTCGGHSGLAGRSQWRRRQMDGGCKDLLGMRHPRPRLTSNQLPFRHGSNRSSRCRPPLACGAVNQSGLCGLRHRSQLCFGIMGSDPDKHGCATAVRHFGFWGPGSPSPSQHISEAPPWRLSFEGCKGLHRAERACI